MFIAARDGFEDISSRALDVSVSYAVRRRFVGQSSKKPCLADPGRHCVPGFTRFLQLLCLFRQGRKSCGRTYQPPFLSFLLLARSRRATSLRLCVGPALQVSQALPRGGAESDFSARSENIASRKRKDYKLYNTYYIIITKRRFNRLYK